MVDPHYTTLSLIGVQKMLHYALCDCLTATYLRLSAVYNQKKTLIHILLIDSRQNILDPEVKYIWVSDEKLSPILAPSLVNDHH